MSNQAHAYAELRRNVMISLRTAHPDWTEDIFADYEARFNELLRGWMERTKPRSSKSAAQMT